MNSYSVSVRLQRLTTEECYVSVPVTEAVMQDQPSADGTYHLDGKKIFDAAIRIGLETEAWQLENRQVSIHQVQKAPDHIQPLFDQQ